MISILVHISNSEPVKIDVEHLPSTTDTCIIGKNPRGKADKEIVGIEEGVTTVIFPWWRINYVQILPSGEEETPFVLPYRD